MIGVGMSDLVIAGFEDARCARLIAPLSAAAPLGVDIRDDPAFEEIETEVRRIDTEGPGGVRWAAVADGGLNLLASRGRDLLLVSWTIYALTQQERWRGLAVGLSVLAPMVAQHWDDILPKRERARVGAVDWMTGRLVALLTDMDVAPDEATAVLQASSLLEELQQVLPGKLVKEQVAIGELVRLVRTKAAAAKDAIARAAAAEAEAAAKAATQSAAPSAAVAEAAVPLPSPVVAPAPVAPTASPAVAPPPPPAAAPPATVGADMERALSALADSMRAHAASLREADLADPRSYRLARASAWMDILIPPPAAGATTQLFAPGAQRLQSLEALHRASEHEAVVRTLEGMIAAAPFWLDAHRLVCDALAALGPRYALAVDAVLEAVSGFIRRLPTLVDLAFSDGTPFADAATRDWLAQQAGSAAVAADEAPSEGLAELQDAVRALIAAGKKSEALDRLAAARARAADGRAVFDIQALQAQLCLDMDLPGIALPLVMHLQAVADARTLDQWEPVLALKAASLAMRACRHPSAAKVLGDEGVRTALEAAQQRLAHLDLRTAARFAHV